MIQLHTLIKETTLDEHGNTRRLGTFLFLVEGEMEKEGEKIYQTILKSRNGKLYC